MPVDSTMRVSAANHPDRALIRPFAAKASLSLQGLSPAQTEDLLHGRNIRELWQPGIRLTLDNESAAKTAGAVRWHEIDLADGKVMLGSGQPGALEVEPQHELENTLIPRSLALLLAQQLARKGLMMVHGAAICIDDVGILVLGERGAGKSVLSAAALSSGGEIVSDDWLLVGRSEDGRFHAERLRNFVMLRHGWAAERLLEALARIGGRVTPGRGKTVLDIEDQSDAVQRRFPPAIALDRAWMLQRPRTGRATDSTLTPRSPAEALAGIIAATMPLLYGREFPVESRELMATARALTATLSWIGLSTGIELVNDPRGTLTQFLTATSLKNDQSGSRATDQ